MSNKLLFGLVSSQNHQVLELVTTIWDQLCIRHGYNGMNETEFDYRERIAMGI
jgi:hypothetical protein